METVTYSCLKCHGIVGTYDNLWDKIGKTYYSPICWNPSAQDLGGLVIDGEVKAAAKSGVIENRYYCSIPDCIGPRHSPGDCCLRVKQRANYSLDLVFCKILLAKVAVRNWESGLIVLQTAMF
jgi:hypothetical protein